MKLLLLVALTTALGCPSSQSTRPVPPAGDLEILNVGTGTLTCDRALPVTIPPGGSFLVERFRLDETLACHGDSSWVLTVHALSP